MHAHITDQGSMANVAAQGLPSRLILWQRRKYVNNTQQTLYIGAFHLYSN